MLWIHLNLFRLLCRLLICLLFYLFSIFKNITIVWIWQKKTISPYICIHLLNHLIVLNQKNLSLVLNIRLEMRLFNYRRKAFLFTNWKLHSLICSVFHSTVVRFSRTETSLRKMIKNWKYLHFLKNFFCLSV